MKTNRLLVLFILLSFNTLSLIGQHKWSYDIGLGTSLNVGNVNNCNINHYTSINRNDSIVALDFHYKFLYSSLIHKSNVGQTWEETNFEINGGLKMDYLQYGKYSPFLACEMLTNKYKGYNLKMSGLVGMKYRIFVIPSVCDYSISAAFVYDWSDFTDSTVLPNNNYRISIRPKIKQKLAENLQLIDCMYYQPSILDFNDYIINNVLNIQTKITRMLYLDFAFTYEYRSRVPSENYKHHDILSEISIRLKF
ncbi:MAG: DUF481 domain-containing protein [Bacteroidales bacterium]|nr:DUF481 domain-containing protein [Bacteroidales bacterium]